jgi:5-methyltetrahydrofolate--homocysteine methyltransferase
VKPNAGLPDENGNYTLDAASFADGVCKLIEAGASVVGGCCGTEPGFITSLGNVAKHHFVAREKIEPPPALCSGTRYVVFDKPVLAGSRLLYHNDEISTAWQQRDFDVLADAAAEQSEEGATLIAVRIPKELSPNEAQKAIEAIQSICSLPLILQTADPETADAALRATRGRPALFIENDASKEALLDIAAKNGAMVIAPSSLREKAPVQQPCRWYLFSLNARAGSQLQIEVYLDANENSKNLLADALSEKLPLILADPADPMIIEAVDKGVFE